MFVVEDMFGYDENVFNKLKYINDTAKKSGQRIVSFGETYYDANNLTPGYSMYGKKVEKQIRNLTKLGDEVLNELREAKKRIKQLADGGKATKTEVDLRSGTYSLYKTYVDISKTIVDFESRKEKQKMDEAKFIRDGELAQLKLSGAGLQNTNNMDQISTTGNYMNNIFSGGVDNFIKNNSFNPNVSSNMNFNNTNQDNKEDDIKKYDNVISIKSDNGNMPYIPPKEDTYENNINSNTYDNRKDDDFRVNDSKVGIATDTKLALKNIMIKQNPNIKEMYKYNKDLNKGWLVWYDTEKNEEVDGGTHLDLRLLFPIEMDFKNNLANTRLETSYPIIYTDDKPSEDVMKKYEVMEQIESNKNNEE